jgi:pimeloyl-ACP methyl ester carboxylesterase
LSRLIRKFPNITIPQDPEAHLSDPDQVELFLELYDTMFPASLRLVGINNDEVQYNNMSPFPFSELSVPILILHGTEDKNVPFETAEFAVRTIPGAELVAIDGGPHEFFLIRSRQEAIIAIVRQFLNDYAPAK